MAFINTCTMVLSFQTQTCLTLVGVHDIKALFGNMQTLMICGQYKYSSLTTIQSADGHRQMWLKNATSVCVCMCEPGGNIPELIMRSFPPNDCVSNILSTEDLSKK